MTNPLGINEITTPTLAEISALGYGQGLGDRAEPRDRAGGGGASVDSPFTSADLGGIPTGWVEYARQGMRNATVIELADSINGYAFACSTSFAGRSLYNYVWTSIGPRKQGQILALQRWNNNMAGTGLSTPAYGPCFNTRINGQNGGAACKRTDQVGRVDFTQSGSWEIPQGTNGPSGSNATISPNFANGARVYCRVVYDVPGNSYQARWWELGTTEPVTWNLELIGNAFYGAGSTNPDDGYVGWGYNTGNTAAAEQFILEWIDANTDPAVTISVPV